MDWIACSSRRTKREGRGGNISSDACARSYIETYDNVRHFSPMRNVLLSSSGNLGENETTMERKINEEHVVQPSFPTFHVSRQDSRSSERERTTFEHTL